MTSSRHIVARCLVPTCQVKFAVKTRQAEKWVPCPKCGEIQTVGGGDDTPAELPKPAPLPRPTAAPRAVRADSPDLSADEARRILRGVADRHKAQGIRKQLDGINHAKVNKATDGYARLMGEDETPLALVDTSFLQNGSAGLLLTNRRVYSHLLSAPVELSEITSAAFEKPTELQGLMVGLGGPLLFGVYRLCGGRPITTALRVNGQEVFQGKCNHAFWIDALTALGQAARQQDGGDRLADRLRRRKELARHLAAAVAARLTAAEVEQRFAGVASAGEVRAVGEELREVYGRRQVVKSAVITAIGFVILVAAGLITLASEGGWLWIGGAFAGLGLFSIGLYRLVVGPPPMTFDALHDKWAAEYE